jgi:hypothetical protein
VSNPPTCLAVDYDSTISTGAIDHLIGRKPVDPEAAAALRTLHDDHGQRVILASSNTQPHEAGARPVAGARPGARADPCAGSPVRLLGGCCPPGGAMVAGSA